jgi:hypothetical protein
MSLSIAAVVGFRVGCRFGAVGVVAGGPGGLSWSRAGRVVFTELVYPESSSPVKEGAVSRATAVTRSALSGVRMSAEAEGLV